MTAKTDGYGIKAVARLTGLPAHTLRLWEERYGALEVRRSAGGHRVYTSANLERLTRLKRLTDQGHRISELAALSDAALERRLTADAVRPATRRAPACVAVFGDTLPDACRAAGLGAVLQISDHEWTRFAQACIAGQPDAVLMEFPDLTPAVVRRVRRLRERCPQARCAASFYFARRADITALHDADVQTLQAPVTAADLWWLVQQTRKPQADPRPVAAPINPAPQMPAPRRFSAGQLARLAGHSSAVACECPAHLVQLVQSLNAFESYSANCENTSPEDAALHAVLHRETARARSIMEAALARLAEAEGIDY